MDHFNAKSLKKLSGDVVMQHHRTYHADLGMDDTIVKNHLDLISINDIDRLSNDADLINDRDKNDNVLQYLLVDNPKKGMIYGARYGLKRLFHIARRSYLKLYEDKDEFKNFIYNEVILNAIAGGSFKLFKSCLDYIGHIDFLMNDNTVLEATIVHDNKLMIDHLIRLGAPLVNALFIATQHDKTETVDLLLDRCYETYETNDLVIYLSYGITIAIQNNNDHIFFSYLSYGDLYISQALMTAVDMNRTHMADILLTLYDVVDNDGYLLNYMIVTNKLDILPSLFENITYNIQMLINIFIDIVTKDYNDSDVIDNVTYMIDAFMVRLNGYIDYKQMLLHVCLNCKHEIFQYLIIKWGQYLTDTDFDEIEARYRTRNH